MIPVLCLLLLYTYNNEAYWRSDILPIYMCGVDSSTNVTNELYQCVIRNFGYPKFWGRYLTRVPNSSEGLTKEKYP